MRLVGKATVARQSVSLAQCQAHDCGLIWAVRDTPQDAQDAQDASKDAQDSIAS